MSLAWPSRYSSSAVALGSPCDTSFLPEFQPKLETRSDQALQRAAVAGDALGLERLLDSGRVHVDCADADGTTALMLAAANNHRDAVQILLQEGAELCAQRTTGTHALFFAAQAGHAGLVEYLVESAGAPVNLASGDGGTPLSVAAQCGHKDVARILVRNGAEVSARMTDGATAAFLAAQNGQLGSLRFLLEKGAEPDAARLDGASPLWIAAQTGHAEVVAELLKAGAEADRARTDGATPLFKAAHKGHLDVAQILLEHRPNLGLLENGESVLHAACLFGHLPIVKMLLQHGANARLKNKTNETPSELAEQMGYEQIVLFLQKFLPTESHV